MKVTGCNTLQYLLQTFVYLFAPICANVRETDFDANMRLVNGRKIWAAMWEYRHPDVDSFTAQVDRVVSWRLDMGMKMMSVIVTWMCALVGDSVCNSAHGTNWLVSRTSWTFTFYWSFTIITLCHSCAGEAEANPSQRYFKEGQQRCCGWCWNFYGRWWVEFY